MSKSSQVRRITQASRALRFLREQAGLSIRAAAAASKIGDGVINHLEHGRIQIGDHHLEGLLPAYQATRQTFEMFASGSVAFPQNLEAECMALIRAMTQEQLRTIYPILQSIASQKQ
jgi:transcriptional regulator with XRE-family HTH domain